MTLEAVIPKTYKRSMEYADEKRIAEAFRKLEGKIKALEKRLKVVEGVAKEMYIDKCRKSVENEH